MTLVTKLVTASLIVRDIRRTITSLISSAITRYFTPLTAAGDTTPEQASLMVKAYFNN